MISARPETRPAFELKGEMSMVSVMRLHEADTEKVAHGLAEKIRQAPGFFANAPVIIDLQSLEPTTHAVDLGALAQTLRDHGFIPIGVRNATAEQRNAARSAGLSVLGASRGRQDHRPAEASSQTTSRHEPRPAASGDRHTVLIDRPVRSGQQVYAKGGDLILVALASPGSELLADGSIHVYGPLRGRALAGATGDRRSRIFCTSLEAELVAIAGNYQVFEDLQPELKGKPAQILLEGDRLVISPL